MNALMEKTLLAVFAGLGATLAIALLSFADASSQHWVLLMAPFGATAVLVFGVPASPLAQPRNVIAGHLITALIGVLFVQLGSVTPLTMALASGLGVSAMLLSDTTHPPAGANPLIIMLAGADWWFLLTPVLSGAVTIVLVGKLMLGVRQRLPLA